MALLSYALCSLNEVKDNLGIDNTDHDNVIERMINSATEQIENFCNRRFTSASYADEIYSGDGKHYLFLRNAPATALTKLQYMTGDYASPKWEDYESDFYNIETSDDKNAGIVYNDIPFYEGVDNIRVSYEAGFSSIPDDVKTACIDLASNMYQNRQSQGIKSESIGDRSVTYFAKSKTSAFDELGLDDVLMQYRIFEF